MNNKEIKLPAKLAFLYGIIILVTAVINLILGKWNKITLSLLSLICIPIPFIIAYIARNKKIVLPSNFQLITLLFLFSGQYLGDVLGFYYKLKWWDLLLHAVAGSYLSIIGLSLTKGLIKKEEEITERKFIIFKILFTFSFSIAMGTLWEMFEVTSDYFFETKMIYDGLKDTASDLLVKIATTFVTLIIYYFHKKRKG